KSPLLPGSNATETASIPNAPKPPSALARLWRNYRLLSVGPVALATLPTRKTLECVEIIQMRANQGRGVGDFEDRWGHRTPSSSNASFCLAFRTVERRNSSLAAIELQPLYFPSGRWPVSGWRKNFSGVPGSA